MNSFYKIISLVLTLALLLSSVNIVLAEEGEKKFKSEKLNALDYVENTIVTQPFAQTQALDWAYGKEDGVNVMYTTSSAKPPIFNVFDLDHMTLLRSFEMPGSASSWEHNIDKNGNVYIITTDKSRLFRYSPVTKEIEDLGAIEGQSACYQSAFDEEGNLYIGTYPGGYVVKYDVANKKFVNLGAAKEGNDYVRSLTYQKGYLWAGSNGTGDAVMVRIDPKTGAKKEIAVPIQPDKFTEVTNIYSQANLGRYCLTYGANGKGNNCWMVFDYQEEKWTDICVTNGGGGIYASGPINGKSYFTTKEGMKAFDIATCTIEDTNVKHTSLTGRKYYMVDFEEGVYDGFGKNTMVTISGGCQPIFVNLETGKVQTMSQAEMKGGHLSLQHVCTGPDDNVYVGAYLGSKAYIYDAKTGTGDYISMGQTENIKCVDGIMYFGEYPKGVVKMYDPSLPKSKTNPQTIVEIKNEQDRPYIIDGDENYIVAGSVATYGKLGGALTIYDKRTKQYEVFRNVVQDHSIVGVAVRDGKVYGSTTVSGGLGIDYTETYAKIFVWDIEKKEKIMEFIPDWPDEITKAGNGVKIIGDLEFGPDGLLWGATSGYVFAYDPATMKMVKSQLVGTCDYSGTGHFWMPRHIRFDKDGLLYVTSDYGVVLDTDTMEYLSLKPWVKNKTNIMDIDSEGNIYYGLVGTLRKVARVKEKVTPEDKENIYNKLGNTVTLALNCENAICKNNIERIDRENTSIRPITVNDRTMLPIRFIAENFDAEVSWNDDTQSATLKTDTKTIEVPINKNEIYINGEAKAIDVPAQLINDRTYLPLRALVEALDKYVFWDYNGLIVVSDNEEILNSCNDKDLIKKTYSYLTTYGAYDFSLRLEQEKIEQEIAEIAENGENMIAIKNSDFEEGNGANVLNWTPISTKLAEGMIYEINNKKPYSGKQSLYLEDVSTTSSVGVFSDPIRVEKGGKYQLNVKLYIDSGRTSVSVRFYDDTLKELSTVSENVSTGQNQWQDITVYAEAPAGAKYAKILLSCSQLWTTQAYYDFVRFYKV